MDGWMDILKAKKQNFEKAVYKLKAPKSLLIVSKLDTKATKVRWSIFAWDTLCYTKFLHTQNKTVHFHSFWLPEN